MAPKFLIYFMVETRTQIYVAVPQPGALSLYTKLQWQIWISFPHNMALGWFSRVLRYSWSQLLVRVRAALNLVGFCSAHHLRFRQHAMSSLDTREHGKYKIVALTHGQPIHMSLEVDLTLTYKCHFLLMIQIVKWIDNEYETVYFSVSLAPNLYSSSYFEPL